MLASEDEVDMATRNGVMERVTCIHYVQV